MFLKEVLKKCEESGHPMTSMGLYEAGKKNGFLTRENSSQSWKFNKDKFLEWLEKATEKVPEGWVNLNELSKLLNISLAQCYLLIKDERSGARRIGAGKGVYYVEPERIKKIIYDNKNKRKINWGE